MCSHLPFLQQPLLFSPVVPVCMGPFVFRLRRKIGDFAPVPGKEVMPHSWTAAHHATDIDERTEVHVDTLQPGALRSHGFGCVDTCTSACGIRNRTQATIQNSPAETSAMSDVSSTDVLSFEWRWKVTAKQWRNCLHGKGLMRAQQFFGPRRSGNVILNLEIQKLCSMNRTTRRMVQEELAVMEQESRLAMHGQNQRLQQLRAAQRHNESTMLMRERDIPFRIGNEAHAALKHRRARMLTESARSGNARKRINSASIVNNNRTISHLKKLPGLGISYTKNLCKIRIFGQTPYERSPDFIGAHESVSRKHRIPKEASALKAAHLRVSGNSFGNSTTC